MKQRMLRKLIRSLIIEALDAEQSESLDDLWSSSPEQAMMIVDSLSEEERQEALKSLFQPDKPLRQAIASQLIAGRPGDTWISGRGNGAITCMYDKRKGTPEINQGIKVEIKCPPDADPSTWTMEVESAWINEFEPARDWGSSGKWNKKMPQDHPLASKQSRPCSFDDIIALFNEFIQLCDELNPDTAK